MAPAVLAGVAAPAAAITFAIAIPLSLLGRGAATAAIPLAATTAAKVSGFGGATGHATARQDASGSWKITLTVHHLKNFGDAKWYQCWYVSAQHRHVAYVHVPAQAPAWQRRCRALPFLGRPGRLPA